MAGSGVWQDCQSLPTCTLHQQVDPHVGKEKLITAITHALLNLHSLHYYAILSIVYSSSRRDNSLMIPMHKIHFRLVAHSQEEGAVSDVIHVSTEWYLACFPSKFQRSDVNFPHA